MSLSRSSFSSRYCRKSRNVVTGTSGSVRYRSGNMCEKRNTAQSATGLPYKRVFVENGLCTRRGVDRPNTRPASSVSYSGIFNKPSPNGRAMQWLSCRPYRVSLSGRKDPPLTRPLLILLPLFIPAFEQADQSRYKIPLPPVYRVRSIAVPCLSNIQDTTTGSRTVSGYRTTRATSMLVHRWCLCAISSTNLLIRRVRHEKVLTSQLQRPCPQRLGLLSPCLTSVVL
jgi:hypothetical protein